MSERLVLHSSMLSLNKVVFVGLMAFIKKWSKRNKLNLEKQIHKHVDGTKAKHDSHRRL